MPPYRPPFDTGSKPLFAPSAKPASAQPSQDSAADWEVLIGSNWLLWVGAVLSLFGIGFFVVLAYQRGYISPVMQITLSALFGAALIGFGEAVTPKYNRYGQTLSGIGICVMYLAFYAGFAKHNLYSSEMGVGLLSAVTAIAIGLAIWHGSLPLVIIGMLGGYATALGIGVSPGKVSFFLSYLFVLNVGLSAVAWQRRWMEVMAMKMLTAGCVYAVWSAAYLAPRYYPPAQLYLLASFIVTSLAFSSLVWLRDKKNDLEPVESLLLFAIPGYYYLFLYQIWKQTAVFPKLGAISLLFALFYAGLAYTSRKLTPKAVQHQWMTASVAVMFITIAIPQQLKADWWTIAWAVEAAALMAIGVKSKDVMLRAFGWSLALLGTVYYLIHDFAGFNYSILSGDFIPRTEAHYRFLLNGSFLNGIACIAMIFAIIALTRSMKDNASQFERDLIPVGAFTAGALSLLVLSKETYQYGENYYPTMPMLRDMLLSVVWAIYSVALIAAGFWKRWSAPRWMGLCLLGITILKVVFNDLSSLDQMYRVISFLAVGIILLVIAGLYTKYKDAIKQFAG